MLLHFTIFPNLYLLSLYVVGFGYCFVQMLTLAEMNQHSQGICHNTQPVNRSFASAQPGKPAKVNSCYPVKSKVFLINVTAITDLQKCSLKNKSGCWDRDSYSFLAESHVIRQRARNTYFFYGTRQPGEGVCFSGCKFTALYLRNVKMVGFGD